MGKSKTKSLSRTILVLVLVAACYMGYRVAAHNNWIIVTRGERSVEVGAEPEVVRGDGMLSILVVGDTGKDTLSRGQVVKAMALHADWSSPDCAILLGDNFYENGVLSVDDPRFQSDFESLFSPQSFDFPFYVCLGNHDYGGDIDAQVQYTSRSQRWKMPERYYRIRKSSGTDTVDLFVLDTVKIHDQEPDASEQIQWLTKELAGSDATWKIVIGHHPALSGGKHGASEAITDVLPPLFEKYGVDLYLSGHDHDLQLCDSGRGWLQVVSGAGSKLRSTNWIDETLFARATPGFCWLRIDKDEIAISFYSVDRRLFTFRLTQVVRHVADATLP